MVLHKNHWSLLGPSTFYWAQFDPLVGNTFLFRSSNNTLVSVSDPWSAFWADTTPFKRPQRQHVRCFEATEKQGYLCLSGAWRRGPRALSRRTIASLDGALVESARFPLFLKIWAHLSNHSDHNDDSRLLPLSCDGGSVEKQKRRKIRKQDTGYNIQFISER